MWERIALLKVLIRICKEVKAFSQFNAYVYASTLVVELSRQNEGWIKGHTKGERGRGPNPRLVSRQGRGNPFPTTGGRTMRRLIGVLAVPLVGLSLGLATPVGAAKATCSPDAMQVGPVCVDRYEASVWSIPAANTGLIKQVQDGKATLAGLLAGGATQVSASVSSLCSPAFPSSFPNTGNWTAPLYAASVAGVPPSACLTWFQAEQACALSGKRLLTNQEWQRAAAGTVDPDANDGLANTKCNTSAAGPRATGNAGATPGGADSCISNWGVQDMVGNVWELVGDWGDNAQSCAFWSSTFGDDLSCVGDGIASGATLPGALFRGGAWNSVSDAGVFAVRGDIDPPNQISRFGFRCAR